MPRKAEWKHRLGAALTELRQLDTPTVDRAAVESLLAVSPRQALRILHGLAPHMAGKSLVVSRADLIAQWEAESRGEPVQRERRRLGRVASQLAEMRQALAARRVPLLPAASAAPELAQLPDGISLAPGRLEIRFERGEELLGKLLSLAQAVADDVDRFHALVGD